MKYLNPGYIALFDATVGSDIAQNTQYKSIQFQAYSNDRYCVKDISSLSTTSIYVKFFWNTNFSYTTFSPILNVLTSGSKKVVLSMANGQLRLTDGTNTLWTGSVPSTISTWPNSNQYFNRYLYLHIDTVLDIVELYSDSIKYASVSASFSGETLNEVRIGRISTQNFILYTAYLNQIIISNTAFPINETITEISPTITSTDWTISSGVASTDNVGSSMTLTAPFGAVDETTRTITGYSVAFIDSTPSDTINAINVTQNGTTKQVVLPSGAAETADVFTVSQLSDISATAVAAYVSQ